jgi:1-acyl-sn-glycerol-3-phosphate acyltransferase
VARSAVYEKGNFWIRVCEILFYPATRLLGRRKYVNLDSITMTGPALLVANHISHLDPLYDAVLVRKTGRWPHILAKASLWKKPVIGRALAATEQIPVERTGAGAGQASLDTALKLLAEGKFVMIYPEGTVTREPDFWPMRPRPGVAKLALGGDFPVIPVAHWGTQQVFNSYAKEKKFRPLPRKDIHVVVGKPIDLSQWRGKPVDARAIRDVSLLIMTEIRDMLAEIRGETPPVDFFDPKKAARQAASPTAQDDPAPGTGQTGS